MFQLKLILRRPSVSLAVLTVSPWYRIILAVFAAILASGFLLFPAEGGLILPLGILIASVLAALYEERWEFDKETGTIRHRNGLLLLSRRFEWDMNGLQTVVLEDFLRGSMGERRVSRFQRRLCRLMLVFETGELKDLEILPILQKQDLKDKGRVIAEICEKPFSDDAREDVDDTA
jgi:hypothetical protein